MSPSVFVISAGNLARGFEMENQVGFVVPVQAVPNAVLVHLFEAEHPHVLDHDVVEISCFVVINSVQHGLS
jgi:hypothetical protein